MFSGVFYWLQYFRRRKNLIGTTNMLKPVPTFHEKMYLYAVSEVLKLNLSPIVVPFRSKIILCTKPV